MSGFGHFITEDSLCKWYSFRGAGHRSYNWSTHEIEVQEGIGKQLPQPGSFGIPVLIMANGEKAYVAALWTGFSSCGTQLPIIDVLDALDDKFRIQLGYPTEVVVDKDPRKKPLEK